MEDGRSSTWCMVDIGSDHLVCAKKKKKKSILITRRNLLNRICLIQLMCNYYTLRQDGSRAYMRYWNLQVGHHFQAFHFWLTLLRWLVMCTFSGIFRRESVDRSEGTWKRPDCVQARAVCVVADNGTELSATVSILQSGSHRPNNWHFQSKQLVHLLSRALWPFPLVTFTSQHAWCNFTFLYSNNQLYYSSILGFVMIWYRDETTWDETSLYLVSFY